MQEKVVQLQKTRMFGMNVYSFQTCKIVNSAFEITRSGQWIIEQWWSSEQD